MPEDYGATLLQAECGVGTTEGPSGPRFIHSLLLLPCHGGSWGHGSYSHKGRIRHFRRRDQARTEPQHLREAPSSLRCPPVDPAWAPQPLGAPILALAASSPGGQDPPRLASLPGSLWLTRVTPTAPRFPRTWPLLGPGGTGPFSRGAQSEQWLAAAGPTPSQRPCLPHFPLPTELPPHPSRKDFKGQLLQSVLPP